MKKYHYLGYGIAIVVGLALGQLIRTAMKPDRLYIDPPPQARPVSTVPSKLRKPSLSLAGVIDLLGRKERTKRTPEEDSLLQAAFFDLPIHELEILCKAIGTLDLTLGDRETITVFFSAWAEHSPEEALAALATIPHHLRPPAEFTIMQTWVLNDTDAAFDYIAKANPPIPPGDRFKPDDPTHELWQHLAESNPQEALSRVAEIPNLNKRHKRENQIIQSMSYTNPKAALDWLMKHREGDDLKHNLAQIINGWGAHSSREALTYLLQLPQELQSKSAYGNLATSMFNDLDTAATMIDEIPEPYRNSFTRNLAEMSARNEPKRASKIAQKMPESDERQQAYNRIASTWAYSDPVVAAEWLVSLPRSPSRDSAIKGFASQLLPHDPETAVTWLADLDRPEGHPSLHNSLMRWLKNDESAAKRWISSQPDERLPENLKQIILDHPID